MEEPCIAGDGHSYEKEAIERWLRSRDSSPKTNERMHTRQVIPNHGLRSLILAWKARNAEAAM